MGTLQRLLRHWSASNKRGHRLFSPDVLQQLDAILREGTQQHQARLGLAIEVALPTRALLRRVSARERAHAVFEQHRATHDGVSCNVLIYINLADRKVEILTDAESGSSLAVEHWCALCDQITAGFVRGDPVDGIATALHRLNAHLVEHQYTSINTPPTGD